MFNLSFIQWTIWTIFVIILSCGLFVRNHYNYWRKRGIPYDVPVIFIGNLNFIFKKSVWDFFRDLAKNFYDYDYYGIFLQWKPALVIQSPELSKKVLTEEFNSFQDRYIYSGYNDPVGKVNLFSVKSPLWSDIRANISPIFTPSRLKLVTDLMNENAEHLIARIQREHIEGNVSVNLKNLFSMYASDNIASTVFGIRCSALKGESSPLWEGITKPMTNWTKYRAFEFITIFFVPFWANIMRLQLFSGPATEYIRKMFYSVVSQRNLTGHTNEKDLVNHLIKLKETAKLPEGAHPGFAEQIMLGQTAAFIFGALETSSTTLSYLLHELAQHPEQQDKLYNEIREASELNNNKMLTYNELVRLDYLTACIFETTRKYPAIPYLERMCNKTCQLKDGLVVEKGTPVIVNILGIHYNDRYFPEPEEWQPERMYKVSDNDSLQHSFLPFGEGPRYCIGKRYGLMQIRTAAANIVLNYKVVPNSTLFAETKNVYSFVLAPKNGGSVRFEQRQHK